MAVYITEAGDVADLIVWRLTGRGAGPAEQLLELTPASPTSAPCCPPASPSTCRPSPRPSGAPP